MIVQGCKLDFFFLKEKVSISHATIRCRGQTSREMIFRLPIFFTSCERIFGHLFFFPSTFCMICCNMRILLLPPEYDAELVSGIGPRERFVARLSWSSASYPICHRSRPVRTVHVLRFVDVYDLVIRWSIPNIEFTIARIQPNWRSTTTWRGPRPRDSWPCLVPRRVLGNFDR